MARFDIYVAKVYFRGSEEYAIRPIIQVKKDADKPFAFAMITSHEKRDWESDVELNDWREAGLKKPSTVRLSERLYNNPIYNEKIGHISLSDEELIITQLNIPHKIYKHKTEDLDDDFDMNLYLLEELKDV